MTDEPSHDRQGNYHDSNGRFVSLKEHFDRILAEKDKKVEADRIGLENRLNETKATTDKALQEAKTATKQELDNAKTAADSELTVIKDRLSKLESGGAPFANRLDEGVNKLRTDVDALNTDAVRTKVLDALRLQQAEEAKTQKKQTKTAMVGAGIAMLVTLVQFIANLVSNSPQP